MLIEIKGHLQTYSWAGGNEKVNGNVVTISCALNNFSFYHVCIVPSPFVASTVYYWTPPAVFITRFLKPRQSRSHITTDYCEINIFVNTLIVLMLLFVRVLATGNPFVVTQQVITSSKVSSVRQVARLHRCTCCPPYCMLVLVCLSVHQSLCLSACIFDLARNYWL